MGASWFPAKKTKHIYWRGGCNCNLCHFGYINSTLTNSPVGYQRSWSLPWKPCAPGKSLLHYSSHSRSDCLHRSTVQPVTKKRWHVLNKYAEVYMSKSVYRVLKQLQLIALFMTCSYSACSMSSLLRRNPQTIVQCSKTGFRGSWQTLGIAYWGLSTPQGQQDGLEKLQMQNIKTINFKIGLWRTTFIFYYTT